MILLIISKKYKIMITEILKQIDNDERKNTKYETYIYIDI